MSPYTTFDNNSKATIANPSVLLFLKLIPRFFHVCHLLIQHPAGVLWVEVTPERVFIPKSVRKTKGTVR